MTATFADDFWPLAKDWRGSHSNPRGRVSSPGKKERAGAEPAWDRCLAEGADPDEICTGARGYLAHIEQHIDDLQHVCQAVTFLNQWRWEQYVELAREMEEKAAEELLERRRNYWRYGRRDALRGDEPEKVADCFPPEIQEAYDQGYREAKEGLARPKLEVVG